MKRLFVLGVLALGVSTFALANPGNGNGNGPKGKPVPMPEGMAWELPLFVIGAGLWSLYRQRHLQKVA